MISVLLIDDQPAFLTMAKRLMEKDGDIETATADSARSAFDLLRENRFDVIISDYEMPGMNGIEFLKSLRAQGDCTPVIIYASKGREDATINAMRSGAEFFLVKSDDPAIQFSELRFVVKEIAKCRNAEETLHNREKDFRTIVDRNADAMIVLSLSGVIRYVNPSALTLFGLPENEMLGKMMGFPLITEEPVEMYVVREFKEFIAVEMRMVELVWNNEPSYLISFRDVTGHIKHEEKLDQARVELETKVQERTSELSRANQKLQEEIELKDSVEEELRVEIEERTTAEEELRTEIEQRETIEKALDEAKSLAELYLDLMGHDINNLNQIGIGYLELAIESDDLDEIKALVQKPLEVLKSSSRIIENVRKIKQIEGAREVKAKQIVNLCHILPEIKARYANIGGRKVNIKISMPRPCFVKANELLADVFANLIDNSIKHSNPDRPLDINIQIERYSKKNEEFYRCTVEDNGPGIPDSLKEKIFMRFERGPTNTSGKGLGLYIVKKLVQDYNGTIWVEDRVRGNYTKGAKFVIMLPVTEK